MYKLCFHVPVTHVDAVKAAIFAAGAGRIGDYDCCAWQVRGEGQFRPLAGANPFIGVPGTVETVAEYKVETVCDDSAISAVVAALKRAHPYEEPSYQVWRLETF